jgi:copper chaperone NosL
MKATTREYEELRRIAPPPPHVPAIPPAPAELAGAFETPEASPGTPHLLRGVLLGLAGFLVGAAVFFPLWELRLLTPESPEGLRLAVYPGRLAGQIEAINAVNRSAGMTEIVGSLFRELNLLPALLGLAAAACFVGIFVRRRWIAAVPLGLLALTAAYGLFSLATRLRTFGGSVDEAAPLNVEPFGPVLLGSQRIGELTTYSFFSWGAFLAILAAIMTVIVLRLDGQLRVSGQRART